MTLGRAVGRVAASLLVAGSLLAGAATPIFDLGAETRGAEPSRHAILALGDSVPSGAACSCTPFPTIFASLLGPHVGGRVTVENYAVNGLDTAGLLDQLRQRQTIEAVRRSNVFLVTIGANDFADHHDEVVEGACATTGTADCVNDELVSMRAQLAEVLSEIRSLRRGQPTSILVTGYWNVFEDGAAARQGSEAAGLQASIRLTRRVNETISSVSTTNGARYVDLFGPFQRRGRAIDSLLAADGDHPDAAGHQLIARTLLAVGLPRSP
jgi:lysophospholipase L1-like esterase